MDVYKCLRDTRGIGQRDCDGVAECLWSNIEERTVDGIPKFSTFRNGGFASLDAHIGDFEEEDELFLMFSFDEDDSEACEREEDYFSFRLMTSSHFEEWRKGNWTAWPDVDKQESIRYWPTEIQDAG